ncbi:MAG: ISAzo13-like element transposase-related protein [Methanosarcina sp.]
MTLVDEFGIEIRIAHYPPYTSKYNPIEPIVMPVIVALKTALYLIGSCII